LPLEIGGHFSTLAHHLAWLLPPDWDNHELEVSRWKRGAGFARVFTESAECLQAFLAAAH